MSICVHRHLQRPAASERGSILTMGAFDGLHRGHQALIKQVVAQASESGLRSVVVTFTPPPRALFQPAQTLQLMSLHDRLAGLAELGVDQVLLLRFNHALARMSAADFATALKARTNAQSAWFGPGFRFGRERAGDLQTLRDCAIDAHELSPLLDQGEAISSSRVRAALIAGDFALAEQLLGRPYAYSGKVVRGQQLGRKLGFPTANLRWPSKTMSFSGIYSVWVHGAGLSYHPGVASLGMRPTVGGTEPLLEAHLLDFDGDLYGQRLQLEFVAKQRDEWHLDGLDALKAQIEKDAVEARQRLAVARSPE